MRFTNMLMIPGVLIVLCLAGIGCDEGGCSLEGVPGTSQRMGPFATQTTAMQRHRELADEGCAVSQGTFPCYDETFTRGYCFNVFFD